MNVGSLKLRLLIAWAIFILITLQVAGVGLKALFDRSITRRTIAELNFDLDQLMRALKLGENGRIDLTRRGPTDPQFDVANGGRYWQVYIDGRAVLSSPSLSGENLAPSTALKREPSAGFIELVAPDKKSLIAVTRRVELVAEHSQVRQQVLTVSAVNTSEIQEDAGKFVSDLLTGLVGIAVVLLIGAWVHVTVGLKPLNKLRGALTRVRLGQSQHIDGTFPLEIQPLVEETNALLQAQEVALATARSRAGDLAHGLKTPLAVMAAKSRQLRSSGGVELADEIDRQIEVMRRHVQRELARARARRGQAIIRDSIDLGAASRDLVSAIQSLPRARMLDWDLKIEDGLLMAVDRADLNDMLGNLLDNAQKWAVARISVAVGRTSTGMAITIEDDGPGVPDSEIAHVLKRGQKADTSRDGSGLGLAIVGDLVELYGGALALSRSTLGGLRAGLTLPGSPPVN